MAQIARTNTTLRSLIIFKEYYIKEFYIMDREAIQAVTSAMMFNSTLTSLQLEDYYHDDVEADSISQILDRNIHNLEQRNITLLDIFLYPKN